MTEPRFASKTIQQGDCHLWTAARTAAGYGLYWNGCKMVLAHRHACEAAVGTIPAGYFDHLGDAASATQALRATHFSNSHI